MSHSAITRNLQAVGEYQIAELLGYNEVAATFRGIHRGTQNQVIIVTLHALDLEVEEAWSVFTKEFETLRGQRFKTLADCLDYGEAAGHYYAVYEWMEGQHIGHLVRDNGLPPSPVALRWIADCCDALATIHRRNIVHRLISPASIFIKEDGTANLLHGAWGSFLLHCKDGIVTPNWGSVLAFVSPEWARDGKAEEPADVYALGAILYFLISGQPTAWDDDPETLRKSIASQPAVLNFPDDAIPSLREVIEEMTAFDPDERPVNLPALGDRLRAIATKIEQPEATFAMPTASDVMQAVSAPIVDPVVSPPAVQQAAPAAVTILEEKVETRAQRGGKMIALILGGAFAAALVILVLIQAALYIIGSVTGTPRSEAVAVAPEPAPEPRRIQIVVGGGNGSAPDPALLAAHQSTVANLRTTAQWMQGFRRINGRWTNDFTELEQLGAVEDEFVDGWGRKFELRASFVVSAGQDGQWDTDDDVWWDAEQNTVGGFIPEARRRTR